MVRMPSTKQHSSALSPTQVWDEKTRRTPQPHQRTIRRDDVTVVTSGFGGKFLPIKMIPILREDSVLSSTIALNFQMAELSNMILNPIRASAMAYFVPKLAQERFMDMGAIDRSYNGIAEADGQVVPWFETMTYAADNEIFSKLGLHAVEGSDVNTDYVEAYNAVWNYIARNRSQNLELRDRLDSTIAPAFWEHTDMRYTVPNFDDAMMDGVVPLSFVDGSNQLPVKSKLTGYTNDPSEQFYFPATNYGDGAETDPDGMLNWGSSIFAEMQAESVLVSIANIDFARETQTWARMRNQYAGLSEEWMMDQLLQGIQVNDTALRDPMLLAHGTTSIGMTERYATDAENLDQSVVDGQSTINLNIRLPQVSCGGTIVVVSQILPEQIFERQRDHYFVAKSVEELPNRTADELDLQPVDFQKCGDVDEAHSTPDDLFGYEPLNARWNRTAPRVGGKYFQPNPHAPWTEVRNRLWDTNVVDPQLGTDFYVSTSLNHDVFKSSNTDPFEIWAAGGVQIQGLTYFEGPLLEATDDYEKVQAQVDLTRLKGDGTDTITPPAE